MNGLNRNWMLSGKQQRRRSDEPTMLLQRRMLKQLATWFLLGTLAGVVALLSACMHQPIKPCETQLPATMPVSVEPVPSETFSVSAQKFFKEWQRRVTGSPQTEKP